MCCCNRDSVPQARRGRVRMNSLDKLEIPPQPKTKPLLSAEEMRSKTAAALPDVSGISWRGSGKQAR